MQTSKQLKKTSPIFETTQIFISAFLRLQYYEYSNTMFALIVNIFSYKAYKIKGSLFYKISSWVKN